MRYDFIKNINSPNNYIYVENSINCNVLVDYIIQGSNDNLHWEDLFQEVNNQKAINLYYFKGQSYQFFRVYITNPSTQGSAARLLEFQVWV